MKRHILALATIALAVSGCTSGVLESTSNVRMTVEDMKDSPRRFWVTLVDQQTGQRFESLRLSGKRCPRGPSTFRRGDTIMVSVDTYRDEKTGQRTRYVDKGDLNSRFC